MILYNEWDGQKAECIRYLIGAGILPEGDVSEDSISDLSPDFVARYDQFHAFAGIGVWSYALHLARWSPSRPVWTGSPPCTPWSKTGRRLGANDDRHLFPAWFDLIRAARPPVVFIEQVSAQESIGTIQPVDTGVIAPPAEWAWIDHVQDAFEGASYAVGHRSFPASSVGAPHSRGRLYAVAHAYQEGLEGRQQHWHRGSEGLAGTGGMAAPGTGGAIGGHWADGARVAGIHGSDRFVEPGVTPLVDGATRDMGCGANPCEPTQEARQLRIESYGDAIVAQQAAAWVSAYMDSTQI